MDVRPVDPRDVRGEDTAPVYRVYFWESTAPAGADDPRTYGMACHEVQLLGASDVNEVIAWADGNVQPQQAYELFVEMHAPELRLIRLAGLCPADPNELPRWRPSGGR